MNRQETVAALMADSVLIPEGRSDGVWLRLMLRASEINEPWSDDPDVLQFGTFVGILPTEDAQVVRSYELLCDVHDNLVPIVDGDQAGDDYLASVAQLPSPPSRSIRWPDGWAIEHVVGWVLGAAEPDVLAALSDALGRTATSVEEVVRWLATASGDGGLKTDWIAYEAVAQIVSEHAPAATRARQLLSAIARVCIGREKDQTLFEPHSGAPQGLKVFVLTP